MKKAKNTSPKLDVWVNKKPLWNAINTHYLFILSAVPSESALNHDQLLGSKGWEQLDDVLYRFTI